MSRFFNGFVKITGWPVFTLGCRQKFYYEDKEKQSRKIKGAAIIMPDHHDVLDFAAMMFTFPRRTLRCLVAEIIYKKGTWFTHLLNGLGAIRVNRDSKDFTFLDKAESVLAKGGVVEIYPESRIPEKGEETPLPFKPSVTYLALSSGAPIIPVATNGSYLKKERLRIIIGVPVYAAELYDEALSEKENIENITKLLRQKVIDLRDELTRQTERATQKEKTR